MSFINKLKLISLFTGPGLCCRIQSLKPEACPRPAAEKTAQADLLQVQQTDVLL